MTHNQSWNVHSPWRLRFAAGVLALLLTSTGCSVKRFAINRLANSLASQGTSGFASDDDPELVGDALPFALKLMEGLLDQVPQHRGLLFATSSGFTQYSYVWVQQPADEMEEQDVESAKVMRLRARKLYLRARDYGIRGLEVKHPGFRESLRRDPRSAVRATRKNDVPLLYWTAASWGAAISVSKDDPDLVADQPIVEALIDRSLVLDPEFGHGAIHGFLISYESARQGAEGDFAVRSARHFDEQVRLTGGQLVAPFVSLAESVSVRKQNKTEFESLLKRALAIDPDAKPEWRLNNIVMQRRARWLLSREETAIAVNLRTSMPINPSSPSLRLASPSLFQGLVKHELYRLAVINNKAVRGVVLYPARQISAGRREEISKRWPAGGFRIRSRNVAASGGQFKSDATSSSEVVYKERRRACGSRRQLCRSGKLAKLPLSISGPRTKA